MKKAIVMLALGISAITMYSCKKSSNSTPASNTMTASINGGNYSATTVYATDSGSTLYVAGITSSVYPEVAFIIPNYNGKGTYTLGEGNAEIDSSTTVYGLGSYGTVNITSVTSTNVIGTFSFTCSDSTKVTNGSFNAKLQ